MRMAFFCYMFLSSCGYPNNAYDFQKTCQNVIIEETISVPFAFEVIDIETNSKMLDGCELTTIKHYRLNQEPNSGGVGDLPPGYYERGCQWDGCNPWNHFNIQPNGFRSFGE